MHFTIFPLLFSYIPSTIVALPQGPLLLFLLKCHYHKNVRSSCCFHFSETPSPISSSCYYCWWYGVFSEMQQVSRGDKFPGYVLNKTTTDEWETKKRSRIYRYLGILFRNTYTYLLLVLVIRTDALQANSLYPPLLARVALKLFRGWK